MFHITIGTAGANPPTLEPDIKMVKAAVLYGDKARLCSAHYSTWNFLLSMKDATVEDMIAQTYENEEMIPHMFSSAEEVRIALMQNRLARAALESVNPSPKDLDFRREFKQLYARQFEEFKKDWPSLDKERAQDQFDVAVGEGLLEIHRFHLAETENIGASQLRGTFQESVEKIGNEITGVIMRAVSDSSTYPLFDDGAGSIIRAGVEFGTMAPTAVRTSQAKQTQLAAELLARLPLFEDASMKEIIDIRRELDGSLIRFRGAIMKYSDKIRNASWDKEFSAEAEETFHREIEPAVLDIEDAVKSNRSLVEIAARKLVDKPALTTSLFSFIVSQISALPTISSLGMSIGIGTATAIYDAVKEAQQQSGELQRNQLYFYYRAKELLNDGTFEYSKG
jgi:hypothetical protein